jgi:hypothetical protein
MTCQPSIVCAPCATFEGEKIVLAEVYFGWSLN